MGLAVACGLAACPPPSGPRSEHRPGNAAPDEAANPVVRGPLRADAVRYEVRFSGRARNRFEVRARYPLQGRDTLTVAMPVWIPGSYLLREFSRHVHLLRARTEAGHPLAVTKVAKNRVRVDDARGVDAIVLEYELYAAELSVRTNYVDDAYAVINPAASFFSDLRRPDAPIEVELLLPSSWKDARAALPRADPNLEGTLVYRAADFDALVDAPIVAGNPRVDRFQVRDIDHELVYVGDFRRFWFERAAQDVQTIVEAQADFWGELPYPSFQFLSVLDVGGGGLEHHNSTLVIVPPDGTLDPAGWRRWLGLVSHELFHAWNGKRLRPRGLGPFDLEAESYTESLWFVEGLTSYYQDLLLRRAGLHDDASYLKALSRIADLLAQTSGQTVQSLAEASYDAWIKFYRRDASSPNTSVNYYTKGAVVGFVLDAALRRATDGRRSLDDVMRTAYRKFSGEFGYRDEEIYDVFEDVGGSELRTLAYELVHARAVLDMSEALSTFGLRLQGADSAPSEDPLALRAHRGRQVTLGAQVEAREGRWVVASVTRGGPAWSAGLRPNDELVAVDEDRVPRGGLKILLRRHNPGQSVEILVARKGRIRRMDLTLGTRPSRVRIVVDPDADAHAERRRRRWLEGSRLPPGTQAIRRPPSTK